MPSQYTTSFLKVVYTAILGCNGYSSGIEPRITCKVALHHDSHLFGIRAFEFLIVHMNMNNSKIRYLRYQSVLSLFETKWNIVIGSSQISYHTMWHPTPNQRKENEIRILAIALHFVLTFTPRPRRWINSPPHNNNIAELSISHVF